MRKLVLTTALGLAFAAPAFAQMATSIMIEPAQRTAIHEYVVQEKPAPVVLKEKVAVGAVLPANVELRAVPTNWGPTLTKYKYIYANDEVMLVDPTSRKVIEVVQ